MSEYATLLILRKQWFKLQAKKFLKRYATGLMVLVIFLPGVAIGDNFQVLMSAVTKPFVLISEGGHDFRQSLLSLMILLAVFVVWAKAQKLAITGGEFIRYVKTLPVSATINRRHDVVMLLIANHLMWPVIFYGFFNVITQSESLFINSLLRYVYLIVLLFAWQYVIVFNRRKSHIISLTLLSFALLFSSPFLWGSVLVLVIINHKYNHSDKIEYNSWVLSDLIPRFFSHNLYCQMLFKSNHSQVVFRLVWLAFLMLGYTMISDHLMMISQNNLRPYAVALEALLAYYFSGFYVMFRDERLHMKSLLHSLPVPALFWVLRDILAVSFVTMLLHIPLLLWYMFHFNVKTAVLLLLYHLMMLVICFPLRKLKDDKQTLFAFIVLFIITAVTIFQLS